MRLQRISSAVAIVLILVAMMPVGVASSPASATILAPSPGATVAAISQVRLHYQGYSPGADSISGYLTLDGEWAGSIFAPVQASPANGTVFNATLRGTNFTSGAHQLGAILFTDVDGPVEAAPVPIMLDLPPQISFEASYDLDTRDLVVDAFVSDEGAVAVNLTAAPYAMNATFQGARTLRLHALRGEGTYGASLSLRDAYGQRTVRDFTYTVGDREAAFSEIVAQYYDGGMLGVSFSVSDPDGRIAKIGAQASGGNTSQMPENGSWSGTLWLPIDAHVGPGTGTVYSQDVFGGRTEVGFSYVIDRAEATLFYRNVTTELGSYQDATTLNMPRVANGFIEICIATCGEPPCATSVPLCEAARGDPGIGAFRPCGPEPDPNQNLAPWALWYGVEAAEQGGPHEPSNLPLRGPWTSLGLPRWPAPSVAAGSPGVCHDIRSTGVGTSGSPARIVVRAAPSALNSTEAAVTCSASWGGVVCPIDFTTSTWTFTMAWTQGPQHRVSVRVVGVPL